MLLNNIVMHRPGNRRGSRGACPSNLGAGGAPPLQHWYEDYFIFLSPVCFTSHSKANMVNQSYFPFLVKSFCYFVSLLQLMHDLKVTRLQPGKRQLLLLSRAKRQQRVRVGNAQVHGLRAPYRFCLLLPRKKMFKKRSFDDPRPISLR